MTRASFISGSDSGSMSRTDARLAATRCSHLPSRDLPSLRNRALTSSQVQSSLQALYRGYQLASPFDPDAELGRIVRIGPNRYGSSSSAAPGEPSLHETDEPYHEQDVAGDPFEDRTARAWLQGLLSGKVTIEEEQDDHSAASPDELLDAAARLLAMTAGKAGEHSILLPYNHSFVQLRFAPRSLSSNAKYSVRSIDAYISIHRLGPKAVSASPSYAARRYPG